MIKTAPGNIRMTNEPNIVEQDIEKHYMLCHDCEELFSAREHWIASNIFNPWQNKQEVKKLITVQSNLLATLSH